jgi:CRISPR-associated endonuclease/helicase Cas3
VPEAAKRLAAKKQLRLHEVDDEKGLADRLAQLAIQHRNSGQAILVYVRKVEDAEKVGARLRKEKLPVQMLTGTMRGLERDNLAKRDPVFMRFLPEKGRNPDVTPVQGTAFLVCTSAGEVGVNISGDHLVCDLTPLDSMAQRLGRVNRFGEGEANVDIVHPAQFEDETDDPYDHRRELTLKLLKRLNGDGSPAALERLPRDERLAAFSPPPATIPTSDILFDAWSLTTIHDRLPGRPPVADFLHGKAADWQPPDTHVAWRNEVEWIDEEVLETLDLSELLDDYPLKPHELLRDRYDRVFKHLASLAEQHPAARAWLVRDDVIEVLTLADLAKREKEAVADAIVVLPPSVGGLTEAGTLGKAEGPVDLDVADEWFADEARTIRQRLRVEADDPELETKTAGMRLVRTLSVSLPEGEDEGDGESRREWQFYVRPKSADDEGSKTALWPVKLADHKAAVRRTAECIGRALRLPEPITQALVIAAGHHDDGKNRALWQRGIGNRTGEPLAKSGHRRPPEITSSYRHEFGSLIDLMDCDEFQALDEEARELALHLVAAHHGRARPHFPADEAFDPEHSDAAAAGVAREVPRRFARLQRKYGRWGLAYLESLLRAADWAASTAEAEAAK